jgi:hypothetical protein
MLKWQLFAGGVLAGCVLYQVSLAANDPFMLLLSCAPVLLGIAGLFVPISWWMPSSRRRDHFKTTQGYVISPKETMRFDGYGIQKGSAFVVDYATAMKAVQTGDYECEGAATGDDAGGMYVNDGGETYGGSFVPAGHIVAGDNDHYIDDRLNS